MTSNQMVDTGGPALEVHSVGDLTRLVKEPNATRPRRLAAGAELARRGDPRAGVLSLKPDWCVVAAGEFVMGAAPDDQLAFDRERPQHSLRLPPFRVSRYPVTNGQWSRFVSDGAYADRRWWLPAGWRARADHGWTEPRFWSETLWVGNQPNRPAVGVSWYEAVAYRSVAVSPAWLRRPVVL